MATAPRNGGPFCLAPSSGARSQRSDKGSTTNPPRLPVQIRDRIIGRSVAFIALFVLHLLDHVLYRGLGEGLKLMKRISERSPPAVRPEVPDAGSILLFSPLPGAPAELQTYQAQPTQQQQGHPRIEVHYNSPANRLKECLRAALHLTPARGSKASLPNLSVDYGARWRALKSCPAKDSCRQAGAGLRRDPPNRAREGDAAKQKAFGKREWSQRHDGMRGHVHGNEQA